MHIYVGNFVHTKDYKTTEILLKYALCVDDFGKILYLKPEKEVDLSGEAKVIKFKDSQFIFPGFIDAHIHAPQYPNCGIFGDSTLLDWLEKYTFPLEAKFKDTSLAETIYPQLIARQLSNGTTTSSYFGTNHVQSTLLLAEACLAKGQRALVGRVCMQRFCPEENLDTSTTLDEEFIAAMQKIDPSGLKVKPIITPRFAPSCDFETLTRLGKLAREHKVPVQTHVSENKGEIEWVAELFPEAKSYTDVYDRAQLLKEDSFLAHSIHLSEEELALIKERKTGVVHCPHSNASIASGIAPVKKYLEMGIKVSLGTDCSGGSTPSILKNARLAMLMSRLLSERMGGSSEPILSVENILFTATLGGAQVLNMQDRVGNFEVGKQFDAQLIDIFVEDSPIDVFDVALPQDPKEKLWNLLQKWLYIGDDRNTMKVWVDGNVVHSRD